MEQEKSKQKVVGTCKACQGNVIKSVRPYHVTVEFYCLECGTMYKFPPFQNPDKKVDISE